MFWLIGFLLWGLLWGASDYEVLQNPQNWGQKIVLAPSREHVEPFAHKPRKLFHVTRCDGVKLVRKLHVLLGAGVSEIFASIVAQQLNVCEIYVPPVVGAGWCVTPEGKARFYTDHIFLEHAKDFADPQDLIHGLEGNDLHGALLPFVQPQQDGANIFRFLMGCSDWHGRNALRTPCGGGYALAQVDFEEPFKHVRYFEYGMPGYLFCEEEELDVGSCDWQELSAQLAAQTNTYDWRYIPFPTVPFSPTCPRSLFNRLRQAQRDGIWCSLIQEVPQCALQQALFCSRLNQVVEYFMMHPDAVY